MRVTSRTCGTHTVAKAMWYEKQASKKMATFTYILIEKWFFAQSVTQTANQGQLSPLKLLEVIRSSETNLKCTAVRSQKAILSPHPHSNVPHTS